MYHDNYFLTFFILYSKVYDSKHLINNEQKRTMTLHEVEYSIEFSNKVGDTEIDKLDMQLNDINILESNSKMQFGEKCESDIFKVRNILGSDSDTNVILGTPSNSVTEECGYNIENGSATRKNKMSNK